MSILSQQKQSVNTDFPNIRPSLDLRFALAKKLDPRVTFARGSTGTYFGPDGLMRTAGVNEPRFDYDPVTGECKGLLIEESRQNLLKYSNSFDTGGAGNWTPAGGSGAVFTQNQTGPDGVANSAWTIDDNYALSDGAGFEQRVSITPSTTTNYCLSIFAKKGTSSFFDFYAFFVGTSTKGSYLRYNFDTDTVTVLSSDGGGITPTIYGKIQYPNDWYRLYFVVNDANSGLNNQLFFRLYPGSRNTGRTGNTLFYGAQLETGAFPTSYIPRGASTVTRSADDASMTGTNFSSWYNQTEGSVFCRYDRIGIQAASTRAVTPWGLNAGLSATNTMSLVGGFANPSQRRFDIVYENVSGGSSSGAAQLALSNTETSNRFYKVCVSYATNNISGSYEGGVVQRDISCLIPTVNRLEIGRRDPLTVNDYLNGHISRLTYYPIQLTNQQLINLTS